jgi:2'-5' RNA ligase
MAFLVIAYPEITQSDFRHIQKFRQQHDLFFRVVNPHFTLVFPVPNWKVEPFIEEITKQSGNFHSFEFCLRCATLNKDAFNDYYHVFLVPDEGYSHLIRLHDKLYSGSLSPHRVLQIDFIPHIGIGNSRDPQKCLKMIAHWNCKPFSISGRISFLDIVKYEKYFVESVIRIPLKMK